MPDIKHQTLELVFPFRLPELNEYTKACRTGKYAGASMKKEWQSRCEWIIRAARSKQGQISFTKPVMLHFTFTEPNIKRDPDNISGFAHKVIIDALVCQGVLFDDGQKYIKGYTDEFRCVKGKEEIKLTVDSG